MFNHSFHHKNTLEYFIFLILLRTIDYIDLAIKNLINVLLHFYFILRKFCSIIHSFIFLGNHAYFNTDLLHNLDVKTPFSK
jgi:hypothetical protein